MILRIYLKQDSEIEGEEKRGEGASRKMRILSDGELNSVQRKDNEELKRHSNEFASSE